VTAAGGRWGLPDAAAGYLAGTAGSILGSSIWATATGSRSMSLGLVLCGLAGLWVGYGATIVLVSRFKGSGRPLQDVGLRFARPLDVATGVVAGVTAGLLLVPVIYTLLRAMHAFGPDVAGRLARPAEELAHTAGRSGIGFGLLVLFVGIGAPVVEECFFRGLLQPAAIRRFGRVAGVVITAAFFALAHLQALQFPGLFAFGLVVGVLALRSGRLGPGIAAHIAFNGLTLLRLYSLG